MKLDITIHRLTPERLADYLLFFDQDAFADNPAWSGCYCYFYHAPHAERDWDDRSRNENRAAVCRLIIESRLRGHLAYADGKVVGWCHATPRTMIPNLEDVTALLVPDTEEVGAIVCFLVARPYRGQGIARQLLDAACEEFRSKGLRFAEAYPRIRAAGDSANYHGPLHMFRSAGFKPFRTFQDFMVVRKKLG
jgi:GNAT superfamily N-acetyltransferase